MVPRILAPVLEPDAAGMLLQAVDYGLSLAKTEVEVASASEANGDAAWARDLLAGLKRTPRWGMNAAMLSRGEREAGVRAWTASGGEGAFP